MSKIKVGTRVTVNGWDGEYVVRALLDSGETVDLSRLTPVPVDRSPKWPEDWNKVAWFRDVVGRGWKKGKLVGYSPDTPYPWIEANLGTPYTYCAIGEEEPEV